MEHSALFWFILTVICIFAEGIFTMGEMAIISFNKVRLQYYVNKGLKRAEWILKLLQKPSSLFGTVLLGVNVALQVGSECSRQFYKAAGLNPDFAFISQFILVVVIAELAPLFAGRRYAEHVAMLESPLIYGASIIMSPVIWLFGLCVKLMNLFFKGSGEEIGGALNREELQKIVEEQDESSYAGEDEEFNVVVANIFHLRSKTAKQVMVPLSQIEMVPQSCIVAKLREILLKVPYSNIPLYQGEKSNIVAIASARDLVRIPDNKKVREFARSPWFITEGTVLTEILHQFRRNKQNAGIVLDAAGKATGLLTLDDVIDEIFHDDRDKKITLSTHAVIDRSFPGDMLVEDFNKEFDANLPVEEELTLEDLITDNIEHHPVVGDNIRIGRFELTVEEASLLGIKSISIRTII